VVTCNFHPRRTRGIYEHANPGIEIHVTDAPYVAYVADSWWKQRESRKVWLLEFTKLSTERG
jgi:hypothetical protein